MKLGCQVIEVTNTIKLSDKRCESDEVGEIWTQIYNIILKDIRVCLHSGDSSVEICQNFQYYLAVEMPLFIEQYRIVYPNGKFDTTMAIKSHILPIIIKMSNKNLNSLMRVTFKSLDSASQRKLRRLTGQVYDSAIRSNHQKRVYRHGVSAGH